jgi:hypothetical protein
MMRVRSFRACLQGAGLVLFGLAVAGASLWALGRYHQHVWTALRGPTEMSLAALAKVNEPSQLPSLWVRVKFTKAYDTGKKVRLDTGMKKNVTHKHLLVQVAERWMIAVVPAGFCGDTLTGRPFQTETPESAATLAAIKEETQEIHQGRLLPFALHTERDYRQTWTYFGIVMGIFVAAGGLFSWIGATSVYQGLYGPAAVSEDEFEKRATVQVDAAIARIFESAGTSGRD